MELVKYFFVLFLPIYVLIFILMVPILAGLEVRGLITFGSYIFVSLPNQKIETIP